MKKRTKIAAAVSAAALAATGIGFAVTASAAIPDANGDITLCGARSTVLVNLEDLVAGGARTVICALGTTS